MKSVGVLIIETLSLECGPHIFRGETAGSFDEFIWDFGPAIGEAIERILSGVIDEILL